MVTALSAPAGASLTGVTLIVKVLAIGSVSIPELSTPPLSRTWKVKFALPFALGAGVKLKFAMFAADTSVPAIVMGVVPSFKTPLVGKVVILTAARLLAAGLSRRSLKPKSAAPKV